MSELNPPYLLMENKYTIHGCPHNFPAIFDTTGKEMLHFPSTNTPDGSGVPSLRVDSNNNLIINPGTANGLLLCDDAGSQIGLFAQLKNYASGQESTGVGSAALGANCPAVTVTAPYKWIKMLTSDGSTVYFPVWK